MKKLVLTSLLSAVICCGYCQTELIEERFAFDPQLNYDPAIPSPESFLGYPLGKQFTIYEKTVNYFEALSASSDKITMHRYGATYEGRELYTVVISSVDNQRNLEQIKADHFKLTDPMTTDDATAEPLIESLPVFTSLSYSIHGNEASTTEAVKQVAYRLVAATDAATKDILDHSVIVLYICINPDGRDRYVYWYNSVAREVVGMEPADLEHYEPWPGGRTNHYWFDLNRDWIWRIHPESQGHTDEYQRWLPNVHVDYHEQGYNSNYYTSPGTTPSNLLIPDQHEVWQDSFGRANIAEFNKHKISYFTRDVFDFFYPGYGSSYPAGFGAVAMLTEQGGIGAGRAVETEDGSVLKLRQRIFDHYTTSLATITKAVEWRQKLRKYSFEALKPANSKSPVKGYFLPNEDDPYLGEVIQMLLDHNVEIQQATTAFTVNAALDYRTNRTSRKRFPQGTYVIPTNQARHLFINSIMQRNLEIEDSVMYDMSTWAAPIAYNLTAYSTDQSFNVASEKVTEAPHRIGKLAREGAQYAYVIDWDQRYAPKALAHLWKKGYRVRAAVEPFVDDEGRRFPAGSLIVLTGRNPDKSSTIAGDMASIAKEAGVDVEGFDTGRMHSGYDLASSRNRPVKQPKAALMIDPPFSSYTAGQIYYLFDRETALPIQRIRPSVLKQTAMPKFRQRYGLVDLEDYNVLILPGGGSGLKQLFGKDQLAALKEWVQEGGVLVATESAAGFFTKDRSKFTSVQLMEIGKDTSQAANGLAYKDRRDYYGKKRIPGSAMHARIDITNPLAFGMKDQLYTLSFTDQALQPSGELQTVGRYHSDAGELLAAGYASPDNLKHLANKTFAGVLPMGRGKVVFLVNNTQYRMFWRGPSRMMQNAVMLMPGF